MPHSDTIVPGETWHTKKNSRNFYFGSKYFCVCGHVSIIACDKVGEYYLGKVSK